MLILLLGLLLSSPHSAPPAASGSLVPTAGLHWLDFPDALARAHVEQRPTLVYVRAPWCGPCRRLERGTFSDAAVRARLERFALTRLTVDDRDRHHRVGGYRLSEAAWAARLGARATPSLVLLDADGGVIARSGGYLPPDGLLPILDAALAAR